MGDRPDIHDEDEQIGLPDDNDTGRHADPLDFDEPAPPDVADVDASEAGETPSAEDRHEESQSETPAFTPDLMARAASLGVDEQQARRFQSPEQLERALDLHERALGNMALNRQQSQGGQQPARQTPQPRPQQQPPQQPESDFQLKELTLDPDEHDDVVTTINENVTGMYKHFTERLQQLEGGLRSAANYIVEQDRSQKVREFDRMISAKADEYGEVLGTGATNTLDTQSPQYQARAEIARTMQVLRAGYQQIGQRPPSEQTLFERAARMTLGQSSNNNGAPDAETRELPPRNDRGQFTAPPTKRSTVNGRAGEDAKSRFLRYAKGKGYDL